MPPTATDVASDLAEQHLRLHLVPGLGALRFRLLVDTLGSVQAILRASAATLCSVPQIGLTTAEAIVRHRDDKRVHSELRLARRMGIRIVCQGDKDYPHLLREIHDAPICLYIKGRLGQEDRSALAIVGSRRCSRYGQEQAYQFGMAAARTGITVVSGLARGVDVRAHAGAVDCAGRTLAVLGCGMGHLERHANYELAQRIIDGGSAILSELPIDRPPDAHNFPPRNRIIAGLSLGTLVIEAARRSGALITARMTLEYNRELFALPGRTDYESSGGTNGLIQRGEAKLTMRFEDILEELGHARREIHGSYKARAEEVTRRAEPNMSDDERTIFDVLSIEGVDLEHICDTTRLPPERISSSLVMLQLKGVVEQLPANRFARI